MASEISFDVRKAREAHCCELCGGVIAKGEEYEDFVGKEGGVIYHFRNHIDCRKLAKKLKTDLNEDRWDIYFNEDVNDAFQEIFGKEKCKNTRFTEKVNLLCNKLLGENKK